MFFNTPFESISFCNTLNFFGQPIPLSCTCVCYHTFTNLTPASRQRQVHITWSCSMRMHIPYHIEIWSEIIILFGASPFSILCTWHSFNCETLLLTGNQLISLKWLYSKCVLFGSFNIILISLFWQICSFCWVFLVKPLNHVEHAK